MRSGAWSWRTIGAETLMKFGGWKINRGITMDYGFQRHFCRNCSSNSTFDGRLSL